MRPHLTDTLFFLDADVEHLHAPLAFAELRETSETKYGTTFETRRDQVLYEGARHMFLSLVKFPRKLSFLKLVVRPVY